jgi:hypothetical protein
VATAPGEPKQLHAATQKWAPTSPAGRQAVQLSPTLPRPRPSRQPSRYQPARPLQELLDTLPAQPDPRRDLAHGQPLGPQADDAPQAVVGEAREQPGRELAGFQLLVSLSGPRAGASVNSASMTRSSASWVKNSLALVAMKSPGSPTRPSVRLRPASPRDCRPRVLSAVTELIPGLNRPSVPQIPPDSGRTAPRVVPRGVG